MPVDVPGCTRIWAPEDDWRPMTYSLAGGCSLWIVVAKYEFANQKQRKLRALAARPGYARASMTISSALVVQLRILRRRSCSYPRLLGGISRVMRLSRFVPST